MITAVKQSQDTLDHVRKLVSQQLRETYPLMEVSTVDVIDDKDHDGDDILRVIIGHQSDATKLKGTVNFQYKMRRELEKLGKLPFVGFYFVQEDERNELRFG